MTITHKIFQSALGLVMVAWDGREICFVHFGESEGQLLARLNETFTPADVPCSGQRPPDWRSLEKLIGEMVNGDVVSNHLPAALHLKGTPFQLKVWTHLKSIPRGEARSYQEVAQSIGHPRAIRAVASACAHNNLALFIPCHRVIRTDGSLGGYKWGIERKRALLESEQRGRPLGIPLTTASR